MAARTAKRLQVTIRDSHGGRQVLTQPIGEKKIKIATVVPLLQAICDAVVAAQLRDARVSCAAGCAHCCYQLIPISPAEAVFIDKLVQQMSRPRRRRIERGMEFARENFESHVRGAQPAVGDVDRAYFDLRVPCPFLEDNRCSIYHMRPLACREYHVDTPRHLCSNPYVNRPRRAATGLNLGALLAAFCMHLAPSRPHIVPLFSLHTSSKDHPLATATFDAEWLFTKLLHGIAKAGAQTASIAAIDWELLDEADGRRREPLPIHAAASRGAESRDPVERVSAEAGQSRNGVVLVPTAAEKRLVQHANAENLRKIVDRLLRSDARLSSAQRFVEIGSGEGYLRYLGNLSGAAYVRDFVAKIVETESNPKIVADNNARGSPCLLLDARDIAVHFGAESTPLVISFNVLDMLRGQTLDQALTAVYSTLTPTGRAIHIMSSAIHPAVFTDIAANHRGQALLPSYRDGAIGVVLVDEVLAKNSPFARWPPADRLAAFFRDSPQAYLSAAAETKTWLDRRAGLPHRELPLHDYSISKLAAAMRRRGFEIEYRGAVRSTVVVPPSDDSIDLGASNVVSNTLGVLMLDSDTTVPAGRLRQTSRFQVLIGKKP